MSDPRRWRDTVSTGILVGLLIGLTVGYLHAQIITALAPVVAEAVLSARLDAVVTRIEHLESMQNYALVAIVGNLVAHLFQIQRSSGRRRPS